MPTTLGTTSITYNDNTTQNSSNGVVKAWVRFSGSDGSTLAVFNVSSVSRIGTGQYTINLSSALTDSNYIIATGVSLGSIGSGDNIQGSARFYTTNSSTFTVASISGNGTVFADCGVATVSVWR